MRKSIRDPFFYNTIDRDDFWNAFVRAFTFRYDKYQEDYDDMLDVILEACYNNNNIGCFSCYYNDEDFFIHDTCSNVIIGWYKHFGRCNCVNVKDFTAKDLYQFFKELRMECYAHHMYHVATPEWRARIEAEAKASEAKRNDPAYQERLIRKVTMNSMYGVMCNPDPAFAPSLLDPKTRQKILKARKEAKNEQS